MFCAQCGTSVEAEARFCQQCGRRTSDKKSESIFEDNIISREGEAFQNDAAFGKEIVIHFNTIPRPWVRFFARNLDNWFWAIVLTILISILIPSVFSKINEVFFIVLILTLIVPIQAFMMSNFGSTIGKYILKIKVTKSGKKLTFSEAFKREFYVYTRAMLFGFPYISIISYVLAYRNLTIFGTATWDRDCGLVVQHKSITGMDVVKYVSLAFGLAVVVSLLISVR